MRKNALLKHVNVHIPASFQVCRFCLHSITQINTPDLQVAQLRTKRKNTEAGSAPEHHHRLPQLPVQWLLCRQSGWVARLMAAETMPAPLTGLQVGVAQQTAALHVPA